MRKRCDERPADHRERRVRQRHPGSQGLHRRTDQSGDTWIRCHMTSDKEDMSLWTVIKNIQHHKSHNIYRINEWADYSISQWYNEHYTHQQTVRERTIKILDHRGERYSGAAVKRSDKSLLTCWRRGCGQDCHHGCHLSCRLGCHLGCCPGCRLGCGRRCCCLILFLWSKKLDSFFLSASPVTYQHHLWLYLPEIWMLPMSITNSVDSASRSPSVSCCSAFLASMCWLNQRSKFTTTLPWLKTITTIHINQSINQPINQSTTWGWSVNCSVMMSVIDNHTWRIKLGRIWRCCCDWKPQTPVDQSEAGLWSGDMTGSWHHC